LPQFPNSNLLIGSSTSDDAAVYKIDEERALVQTVDFFTPIVDDPYLFGKIAATNSLSDVYAMGGRPITAMNLLGIPEEVDLESANLILLGGAEQVAAAQCSLAGGHSIKNPEPIYGLSVTGLVHPKKIISNAGARPGDKLVLTKPIGNGIVGTAIKRGICPPALEAKAVEGMTRLNTPGTRIAEHGLCVAGTDITGFGLLGHLGSLCASSNVSVELDASAIPLISPEVDRLIREGCVPGGTKANLKYAQDFTLFEDVPEATQLLLADAQTAGGLLLAIPEEHLSQTLDILDQDNALCAAVIGQVGHLMTGGIRIRVF
jgi:selenide, water dikinase